MMNNVLVDHCSSLIMQGSALGSANRSWLNDRSSMVHIGLGCFEVQDKFLNQQDLLMLWFFEEEEVGEYKDIYLGDSYDRGE